MGLLAHAVGLGQPARNFLIDLIGAEQTEDVHVIAGTVGLDCAEAGILQAPGEHDMTVKPLRAWGEGSEAHADLQSDPGLLRKHGQRSVAAGHLHDPVEGRSDLTMLADEVRVEVIVATRMALIAVGELTAALRATP